MSYALGYITGRNGNKVFSVMETHVDRIGAMMRGAGINSIEFLFRNRKPRIQRDGITYEILSILTPDDGDKELIIGAMPSYAWKLVNLFMDESWRESSWKKIRGIVEREIAMMEEM